MRLRIRRSLPLLLALGASLSAACDQRAFVVLEVTDPEGLATEAVAIRYGEDGGDLARVALEGQSLPLTQTLVGGDGEARELWVEALGSGDTLLARAAVSIAFDIDRTVAATAVLGRPCEADTQCDDALFCTGVETCVSRVCVRGEDPCPPSPFECVSVSCNEAAAACVLSPDHGQCDPLPIPGTQLTEPTYCDTRLGCVPGEGCDDEGEPCPRNALCEWHRTCISGRCIPTAPLEVDDQNPCTVDYCELGVGEVHAPDPFANGNTCPLGGGTLGMCLQGACVISTCGDGFLDLDSGEECDTGVDRSDTEPNACRVDCSLPSCGDGVPDSGEPCDDGNAIEGDDCRTGCILNVCGDGIWNPGAEECDDGDTDDTDECVTGCKAARCGDAHVWAGREDCDDGNASEQDPCLTDCTDNVCGDGHHDLLDEECDDGNTVSTDTCLITCEDNVCGDGIQDLLGELCDDGNTDSFDGCSADCDYTIWETDLGDSLGEVALVSWSIGPPPLVRTLGVGTLGGSFHALDSRDGSVVWSYTASAPIQATALVVNQGIALLSTDGRIHSLQSTGPDAGGNAEWTFDLPTTSSATGLIRDQPGVLAVDDAGTLSSVDASGAGQNLAYDYPLANGLGTCANCAPTSANHSTRTQGVIVALGETLVGADFSAGCPPTVLPLLSGETIRGDVPFMGDNSTGITERDKGWMVTSLNRVIQAQYLPHDPATCLGSQIVVDWTWASGTSSLVSPVVIGGPYQSSEPDPRAILLGGADGLLHRLNLVDQPGGGPAWSQDLGAAVAAPAALSPNHAYVGSADGRVHKLLLADGSPIWEVAGPGPASGSPLLAGDAVFVSTRNGRVFALERGADMENAIYNTWHRQRANNRASAYGTACESTSAPLRESALFWLLFLGAGGLLFRRRGS